ncbi:MAG: Hsp20 family protein [Xanthomonadales bacterium]|nr:Hsp20 family protein [Xanthomonadales bacterium]
MTTFDFSPLYRTSVGFDRLASLMSSATRQDQGNSYPPYNIRITSEDHYRITMAVAGFSEDEIAITSEQSRLLITGNHADEPEGQGEYLHRGIATRTFERRFNLADHVRVIGASLENGLLHIDLEREIPEAMKPRTIKIAKTAAHLLDTGKDSKVKKVLKSEDKAA